MTNPNEIAKVPFLRKVTPFDKTGEPGAIRFEWGDGTITKLNIAEVSEQNKTRAMYHGLSQRLGDAVAGCSKDNAYGYAREQQAEIIAVLNTENWTKPSTAGIAKAETEQSIVDLIESIAKIKKQPVEKVDKVVREADRITRDTWRRNPAVAVEVATLVAKRAKESAKEASEFDFPI